MGTLVAPLTVTWPVLPSKVSTSPSDVTPPLIVPSRWLGPLSDTVADDGESFISQSAKVVVPPSAAAAAGARAVVRARAIAACMVALLQVWRRTRLRLT